MPSQYIDPRYANNGYQPPVAEIAQAAQNPQHPANPSHPKVSELRSLYIGDIELMLMDVAWGMGRQDWCQVGECRHFWCGGYYGVGFSEFDSLKVLVYKVHKGDVLHSYITCLLD